MKHTILDEEKEGFKLKNFIKERIIQNNNLFSDEELTIIKNNSILIEKIYLLGILDSR